VYAELNEAAPITRILRRRGGTKDVPAAKRQAVDVVTPDIRIALSEEEINEDWYAIKKVGPRPRPVFALTCKAMNQERRSAGGDVSVDRGVLHYKGHVIEKGKDVFVESANGHKWHGAVVVINPTEVRVYSSPFMQTLHMQTLMLADSSENWRWKQKSIRSCAAAQWLLCDQQRVNKHDFMQRASREWSHASGLTLVSLILQQQLIECLQMRGEYVVEDAQCVIA
jgi:hypothetical protein